MKAYVIDSNMLESGELRSYLAQDVGNLAILPDFSWHELYKQQTLEGLKLGLSVLGDYPDQVVLLRPSEQISQLDPEIADDASLFVIDGPDGDISEMVQMVRAGEPMDPEAAAQLNALWSSAHSLHPSLIEGANDIAVSYPEMEEQMFSSREIGIIRRNERYTIDMFSSIFGAALQIWECIENEKTVLKCGDDYEMVGRTYKFRYALGLVIGLLWWIRCGSQAIKNLSRMNNDLIDLSFAVHATYFDGLFTRDKKAAWVHTNLVAAINSFRDSYRIG